MPPVLMLGCFAALAVTTSPTSPTAATTATTGTERCCEADRVLVAGSRQVKAPAHAREGADADDKNGKLICTLRIMRADPNIDRAMVVALERPVDPEMVVPSRCAAE